MTLRAAYTLWAPIYDLGVAAATRELRRRSVEAAELRDGEDVLLVGVGTGLDFPHLPRGPRYAGVDLTPAMLGRARRRAAREGLAIDLSVGDAMALPFPEACFDVVIMHLIVAVVPDPARALAEASRVLRPGGRIAIADKFLRPGQAAPLRRLAAPIARRLATRTDVVFEDLLAAVDGLDLVADEPAGLGGWFRRIRLRRPDGPAPA